MKKGRLGLYCPKCNSEIAVKKGKYGDFYGCTNFPKCKFTSKTRFIKTSKKEITNLVLESHFNTTKG